MGVEVRVTLFTESESTAQNAARSAFARFSDLDSKLSDYQQNSELNKLLPLAAKGPTKVSDDMFRVFAMSQEMSRRTEGSFDITVRPLVALWRTARKTKVLPSPVDVVHAQKLVGWQNVILDSSARTVRFAKPGVLVDFGGIAKGFACSDALRAIQRKGVRSAMVEAGGDLACGDAPPNQPGWTIQIEGTAVRMLLKDQAMSTSGSTEQFVEIDGKRYSHIIDPRTGLGLSTIRQVTVIGKSGLITDPLATALCINMDIKSKFPEVQVLYTERTN